MVGLLLGTTLGLELVDGSRLGDSAVSSKPLLGSEL